MMKLFSGEYPLSSLQWVIGLLLLSNPVFGQIIEISDSQTHEKIDGIHIYKKGTEFGVVSNREGLANLTAFLPSDTLVFSHVGYHLLKQIKRNIDTTMLLEPKAYMLGELVIPDISAKALVERAVNLQKEHLSMDLTFQAYYREYVLADGNITKYADGDIAYMLVRPKEKNTYTVTSYVLQSRKVELETETSVNLDMVSQIDIGVLSSYNSLKSFGRFLDASNSSSYEYSHVPSGLSGMYLIRIKPKSDVEEFLYTADVLIDATTGFISEIQYRTDSSLIGFSREVKILGNSVRKTDMSGILRFINVDGKNYLHYGNVSISLKAESKNINQVITFLSEMMVYANEVKIDEKAKPYKYRSLFKSAGEYNYPYWEKGYSTPLQKEYEQVISRIKYN